MGARLATHSDSPTFEDKLKRGDLVRQIAREIATGTPSQVFGIHGDWGSGKTSFLCQLEHELTGLCSICPEAKAQKRICEEINHVFTVWFEAWRYQNEPTPVVALLHEICRQLPRHEKIKRVLTKWEAVLSKGILGAIDEVSAEVEAGAIFEKVKMGTKMKNPFHTIREERNLWEEGRYAGRLTSDHIRELLCEAIEKLLGNKERVVCVIIDDLDRCDPSAALRLLEASKFISRFPSASL